MKKQADQEECDGQQGARNFGAAVGIFQGDGEFDRKQAEERGELDDRVHRDRTGVLERVADGVADHAGIM